MEEFEAAPRHPPLYLVAFAITILLYDLLLGVYFVYLCDPAFPTDLFATSPNKDFWITLYNPLFRWVGHYAAMIFGITSFTAVFMVWMGVLSMRFSALIVMYLTVNTSVLAVLLEPYLVGVLNIDSQGFLAVVKGQTVNYYNMIGWSLTHIHSFFPLWSYWLPLLTINYFIIEYVRQQSVYGEYRYFRTLMCRYSHCPSHILLLVNESKKKARKFLAEVHQKNLGFQDNQQANTTAQLPTLQIEPPTVVAPPPIQEIEAAQRVKDRFQQARNAKPLTIKPLDFTNPLKIAIGVLRGQQLSVEIGHTSIGGMTGAGKTRLVWDIVTQLILHDPKKVRLCLVCAKQFKTFRFLDHLPHVAVRVTESDPVQFKSLVDFIFNEQAVRFAGFQKYAANDIGEFNQYCKPSEILPYIVVVVDEMSYMVKNISGDLIQRFFDQMQILREAGIFILMASQNPSAETFPKEALGNVQLKIALRCADRHKSVIVIGKPGAEKLDTEKRESIVVSGAIANGEPVIFNRTEVNEKMLLERVQYSEQRYGYNAKVKAEFVEALKRRRTDSTGQGLQSPKRNLLDSKLSQPVESVIQSAESVDSTCNGSGNVVQIQTTKKPEEKYFDIIVNGVIEGKGQRQIEKESGISQATISRQWREFQKEVKDLQSIGKRNSEICDKLGVKLATLVKYLQYCEEQKHEKKSLAVCNAVNAVNAA